MESVKSVDGEVCISSWSTVEGWGKGEGDDGPTLQRPSKPSRPCTTFSTGKIDSVKADKDALARTRKDKGADFRIESEAPSKANDFERGGKLE